MDTNFTFLLLAAIFIAILVFLGREFEEHYPSYTDYVVNNESTLVQKIRTGAFLLLDHLSDMCWPGKREYAISYKHTKRSKTQILSAGTVSATISG